DDQGAIDMWGDPSHRGNVFCHNVFRDIGNPAKHYDIGAAAIRLDDLISGVFIHHNVFINSSLGVFGAIQIHGGTDNVIRENLFRDCATGVSFQPRGEAGWRRSLNEPEVANWLHKTVDIEKPPYSERYPELKNLYENHDANRVQLNRFENCAQRFRGAPVTTEFIWND
ncbi:MAG: hypothetical protein FWG05_05185, partial [Kiritimatiellaeota bacterium]|nr:hypothetical protein [Kiritimatiellota bacterium]